MSEVFPRDILVRVGGKVLQRHGVLAVSGAARGLRETVETFTRADAATCATFVDSRGIVRTALANRPRIEWVDLDGDGVRETPCILLEGTRQNLILRSEELDNGAWTVTNVTFGGNADVAPDGTTTAERLIENGSAGEHMVSQQVTATADVRHSASVFAKAGTRSFVVLTIRDVSAGTNRVQAWFNLGTGAVGTVGNVGAGTGAQAFIEKVGSGWYRCKLIGACNNGDTTPILTVQVANADGTLNYTGDGASYISAWGAQFENNAPWPSSYIKTVASAVTRAADDFLVPFNAGPSADITLFARVARPLVADVTGTTAFGHIADIGWVSSSFPTLLLNFENDERQIQLILNTPTTDAEVFTLDTPAGAEIVVCAQVRAAATTGGMIRGDVGSGFSAEAGPATPFSAWGAQTLRVGGLGSAGTELYGGISDIIVARGLFTRAEMLAIP